MPLLDKIHMTVEDTKKLFHRLETVFHSEAKQFGQRNLMREIELIAFSLGQMMEQISNPPDKGKGFF